MNAGTSGTPLPKKLGIDRDSVYVVRRPPADFAAMLGNADGAVQQQTLLPPIDVVVAFHTRRDQLRLEWPKLAAAVEPAGSVWIAWPKRTSGVTTDITEDTLRAELMRTGWVDNKECAIDDTWSALRFVQRSVTRRPKDNARKKR